jgi:hypothetical protein
MRIRGTEGRFDGAVEKRSLQCQGGTTFTESLVGCFDCGRAGEVVNAFGDDDDDAGRFSGRMFRVRIW